MSIAQAVPTVTPSFSRWLLLSSLALNLFFIGVAVAMAIRPPVPSYWDRDVFVRVERLAATLPPADADLLRGEINANRAAIAEAQTKYRDAREQVHTVLRQQPFDPVAMRTAMAQTRAVRQAFDQVIHGIFADAAEKMSSAGRHALADWPPNRNSANKPQ